MRLQETGRGLHRTHVLDIIGGYGLAVAVNGALGYNYNVQPFPLSAVLEGCKKKQQQSFEDMTGNVSRRHELDSRG